jgi:hypothetical protein
MIFEKCFSYFRVVDATKNIFHLTENYSLILLSNPKGLVQVVNALVLEVYSLQGLRFNTS